MLRTYFFPRYRFGETLLRQVALAKGKVNGLAAGKVEKHVIKDVFFRIGTRSPQAAQALIRALSAAVCSVPGIVRPEDNGILRLSPILSAPAESGLTATLRSFNI
jgi:hypothetical protein